MRHRNLILFVLAAAILTPVSVAGQKNAPEGASLDATSVEIKLDQPVHFSSPDGEPITLAAGRYRVEKRDAGTLAMLAEDGASSVIVAAASEHDEAIGDAEALSVAMGNGAHRILLLQTDGTSLEAAGTYSGVVSRAALSTLSRTQVNTAYQNRLQTRIQSFQTIDPQPQAYDGKYQTAETWQQTLARRRAGQITSSVLRNAIGQTFRGATLKANACGPSYTYRKTIINVPTAPLYQEQGMQRLHYDLSGGERERSEYVVEINNFPDAKMRRYSIRACVDSWQNRDWQGQVAGGLMEVHIPFGDVRITTRAIDYCCWGNVNYIPTTMLTRTANWGWNDDKARRAIRDRLRAPVLIVTLEPKFAAGKISYQPVNARWRHQKDMWSDFGEFRLVPNEPDKINSYMYSTLEVLRQRYLAMFNNENVRNQLSEDLTNTLLTNSYVNNITGIDGPNSAGTVITVSCN